MDNATTALERASDEPASRSVGRRSATGWRPRGRPEEWLVAVFLLIVAMITVSTGASLPSVGGLLTALAPLAAVSAVALIVVALIRRRSSPPWLDRAIAATRRTGRALVPLAGCLVSYLALRDLTPVLAFPLADHSLAAIDRAVFGTDVSRWLDDHIGSSAMTLFMAICYLSYGTTQAAYALTQNARGRWREYREFALAVVITAVIGYSGYILVPGVGPHVWQAALYADPLPGQSGVLGAMLDNINNVQGPARDVFPSLHTAMTLVLLGYLWRDARKWFWWYLPIGSGLLLSTLYLRKHYLVDVVAGIVVAAVAMALAGPIRRWWFDERQ